MAIILQHCELNLLPRSLHVGGRVGVTDVALAKEYRGMAVIMISGESPLIPTAQIVQNTKLSHPQQLKPAKHLL